MRKKLYERPTMNIVKLQQQTHLLAGSGVNAMRNGYGTATDWTWGDGGGSSAPSMSFDDEDFLEFLRFTTFIQ